MNAVNTMKNTVVGGFFSSTMWFGFLIMAGNWLNNNSHVVAGWFPKEYNELILYAVGAGVWFFRWITTKPLAEKSPAGAAEVKAEKVNKADEALENALAADNLDDF